MQSPTRICYIMEGRSLMIVFAYTNFSCFFLFSLFLQFSKHSLCFFLFFPTFYVCPLGQNNLVFYQVLFEYSHSIVSYVLLIMNSTFSKQTNRKPTEKLTFGVYSFFYPSQVLCVWMYTYLCKCIQLYVHMCDSML